MYKLLNIVMLFKKMFIDQLHDLPKLINKPSLNIKNKIANGTTVRIITKDLENNIDSMHYNDIMNIIEK